MRTVMLIIGAACAGLGILTGVISGFGLPDGADVATRLSTVGFDALELAITAEGAIEISCGLGLFAGGDQRLARLHGRELRRFRASEQAFLGCLELSRRRSMKSER